MTVADQVKRESAPEFKFAKESRDNDMNDKGSDGGQHNSVGRVSVDVLNTLIADWRDDARALMKMSRDPGMPDRTSQVNCYVKADTLRRCARELKRRMKAG